MKGVMDALKNIRARRYGKRCQNWKERLLYIFLTLFVVSIFVGVLGLLGYGMFLLKTVPKGMNMDFM